MMNKNKLLSGEEIKNIFAQIETPEYNPSDDVMKKIRQEVKPRRKNKRRILIIAAVFAAMIFMMSAAGYWLTVTVFDFNGNIRWGEKFFHTPKTAEVFEFENGLIENKEENAVLFIIRNAEQQYPGIQGFYPHKIIYDYEELRECAGEGFKLPEYIPDGYKFSNARIDYRINGDINYEELEAAYYEEKFGNIYEKYILYEDDYSEYYYNISLWFNNEDKQIVYNMSYSIADVDSLLFVPSPSMQVTSEPEVLNLPQFDRSIGVSYIASNYQAHSISAAKFIEPFDIFNSDIVCKAWRELQINNYLNNTEIGSVMYNISSASIPCEEIIKMAESIK